MFAERFRIAQESGSLPLYLLGLYVLVGSNASLFASGWITAFDSLPPKTGIYVLDLLLEFFPQVLKNPSTKIVYDTLGGVAVVASTAVIFEGSRRRGVNGGFSQRLLGAYWTIAQFVAIGFATPLYFGFYVEKPLKTEDYVHIGALRAYGVFLIMLLTGVLNHFLEQSITDGAVNQNLLIAWLFLPVIGISAIVLLDGSKSAPRAKWPVRLTYLMAFLVSVMGHARVMTMVVSTKFKSQDIISSPPCVFLIFDLIGVMVGAYSWIHQDGRIPITTQWPFLFICGPGGHLSLLMLMREEKLDAEIDKEHQS